MTQKTSRSSIITGDKSQETFAPVPPGEILLEEFMRPLGVSQNRLSRDIDVPVSRISAIVKGERAITADTALRLARYFGTSAKLWLNLQADYELRRLKSGDWVDTEKRIRPLSAA
jgi:addiction module HigA family antidote